MALKDTISDWKVIFCLTKHMLFVHVQLKTYAAYQAYGTAGEQAPERDSMFGSDNKHPSMCQQFLCSVAFIIDEV